MPSDLYIHSESQFRRFEPYISAVLANHPSPTEFTITSNRNTFVARFRDALNGMRVNNWKSKLFTISDCEMVFSNLRAGGDFIITAMDGKVYVGPRIKDNGVVNVAKAEAAVTPTDGQIDGRKEGVFEAFMLLKSHGYIDNPLRFVNLSEQQQEKAESEPTIEFFNNGDGEFVMI